MNGISLSPRSIGLVALVTVGLLMIPLLAMQLTDEVRWDLADFAVAAALLFSTGLVYFAVASKAKMSTYRAATALAATGVLALVWINLAVGLIGSSSNPANLLFAAVIVVAAVQAVRCRFESAGMANAMLLATMMQTVGSLVALIVQTLEYGIVPMMAIPLHLALIGLFMGSMVLYRRAAHRHVEVVDAPQA